MVAMRSRPSCFSLSKVSSSKAINLRTSGLPSCVATNADSMAGDGNRSGAEPAARALVKPQKGDFLMTRISVLASAVGIAILASPIGSLAQSGGGGAGGGSAGGAASGPSTGSGSAAGSPSAGSAGAGTAGVSGVPSGPANAGGLNNSGNDPSGAGNSAKAPEATGTNAAGTANSSGSTGGTGARGSITTGTAGNRAGGTSTGRIDG